MSRKKSAQNRVWRGVREMGVYIEPHRSLIITLSITGVLSAFATASIPFLVGRFFDELLLITQTGTFTWSITAPWALLLMVWLVVQMVTALLDYTNDRRRRELVNRIMTTFNSNGFKHMLNLPIDFHGKYKGGEMRERINRAAGQVAQFASIIAQITPQLLSVVIGTIIVFLIDYRFTLIMYVGIAVYCALMAANVQSAGKMMQKGQKAFRRAFGDAYDSLNNMQTVKQAANEKYEQKRMDALFTKQAYNTWMKIEYMWSNVSSVQRFVVIATQLSIFLVSISMVADSTLTIGELIALNSYAALIFGPFAVLANRWQTMQNAIETMLAAKVVLDTKPEVYEPAGSPSNHTYRGHIGFENVHFAYEKGEEVLRGINFSVAAGERVALVGESGAGKSTTLELISAYHFPQKGSVTIDGVPSDKHRLLPLRSEISVVPQEPVLFNETILDNIRYGSPSATVEEVEDAAKKAHAHEFILRFKKGYKSKVGERGVKLSGGQKQRIAIARAMLRDPKILILDEPTSALDAKTESIIKESFDKLMTGRTTLIVAHRLSTVREADRILVFDKGRVIESGTHSELIAIDDGVYKNLYDNQIGLYE